MFELKRDTTNPMFLQLPVSREQDQVVLALRTSPLVFPVSFNPFT
jgi:hypothetical protein